MPIRKKDYHPEWPRIAAEVKTDAGWMCEWCMAKHKTVIRRHYNGSWIQVEEVGEEPTATMSWARLRYHGLSRIIITTAHLDRDSTNNERENLAALCQKCHLRHDIRQHIRNRKYGRYHDREHQLTLSLK